MHRLLLCAVAFLAAAAVARADDDQPFVQQKSPSELILGIGSDHEPQGRIRVSFASLGARFAELPVDITVTGERHRWSHRIATAREAARLSSLRLPPGRYTITFDAPRHVKQSIAVDTKSTARADFALKRKLAVTARVIERGTGLPVANALVISPLEATAAMSSPAGLIDDDWLESEGAPPWVTVTAPNYAPQRITAVRVGDEIALGLVELSRGGTIRLEVTSNDAVPEELSVTVWRRRTDAPGTEKVTTAARATGTFGPFEAGEYIVSISGKGPLEQAAAEVEVREGEQHVAKIHLTPILLRIAARSGSKPVPNATVKLRNAEYAWTAEVALDSDGRAAEPLWQSGRYLGALMRREPPVPHPIENVIPAQSEYDWEIVLPDREVRGRVVDATTSKAIGRASVDLRTRRPGTTTVVGTSSRDDGTFVFEAVSEGAQTVSATADGYLNAAPVYFAMTAGDHAREVTIQMHRAQKIEVRVSRQDGHPVADAYVTTLVGGDPLSTARTDPFGVATVQIPMSASALLAVFDGAGSFRTLRIPVPNPAEKVKEVPIVLAAPLSALTLRTSNDGQPVPGVAFVFRVDGEFIPPEAIPPIHPLSGSTNHEGVLQLPHLPPGRYEIWPYRVRQEAMAIIGANGEGAAPTVVPLTPGAHAAELMFRRR